MDAPRPQRNRIHIDVYVSQDEAEARVAAGLAAGGHAGELIGRIGRSVTAARTGHPVPRRK
jgi:predicted RNA-binding protein YlqC (UPF0109 family)